MESISLLTHSAPIDVDREISTLLDPQNPFGIQYLHFEQSILSSTTFGNFLFEQERMFSSATLRKESNGVTETYR